jgi:hypothetical protein
VQARRRASVVVKAIQDAGKPVPFFILDEMSVNQDKKADRVQEAGSVERRVSEGDNAAGFQRNVFCQCGLVVTLMGTDAKVTSLLVRSAMSRCECDVAG